MTPRDICSGKKKRPGASPPVYSLVMAGRHFKLAEEYVSVAKVTVGPPLCGLIPKLFGDEQPLHRVEKHTFQHISAIRIHVYLYLHY